MCPMTNSATETEGNPSICNIIDGSGGDYDNWNKPVRERQILLDVMYTWNLKRFNS